MGQFPVLNKADIDIVDGVLQEMLRKTEASVALLVEKAGYLIHQCGNPDTMDTATFATLGSNAYNAVQFMASMVNENNFSSMYQQGENFSTLMLNVDENALLVVVFGAHLTVGSMKYYAAPAAKRIAEQIHVASGRADAHGLDLSHLDVADSQALFQRRD